MEINGKKVKENIPLKSFTTFKVGGPTKYFFVAKNKEDLIAAIKKSKKENIPFFILGGGSDLLMADEGYDGMVISIQLSFFKFSGTEVKVGAGLPLKKLVKETSQKSLTGFEWAEGIPGTIGGAICGNVGAFNSFIEENIKDVEVLDSVSLETKNFSRKECFFSSKNSIFRDSSGKLIILSAVFNFKKGDKKKIKEKIEKYANYRKDNHPLEYPSAGCIFKNINYERLDSDFLVKFPELEKFKEIKYIPSAFLIEKSGLKGKKIGEAQVSEKHANFIVNLGGAEARDIFNLIKLIKMEVKNRFGVRLIEELQYIGF